MSKLEELIQQYCPDGVEYKTLGEVCEFVKDGTHGSFKDVSIGYPLLSAKDINQGCISIPENCRRISLDDFNEIYKKYRLAQGDVLITIVGTIGRIAIVQKETQIAFQRSVGILRPMDIILSSYLAHTLQASSAQKQLESRTSKSAQGGVYLGELCKISIPVPPLPVQEEIVRILDALTAYTAELQAELQARRNQYDYYRNRLLSFDGDTSVQWRKLGDVCENCDNQRIPITSGKRKSGDYPYYGASGIVDYVDDYIFDGDYLLVSEDGANLIARHTPIAFSISGKNWVNNHAHVLHFNTYEERKFVEYYLNMIDLAKYISGGAQPKLNQQNLNSIPIPVPSLSEQQRIVDILDRFDTLCNDLTTGLPAEIEARQKQYEHYRDRLLSFKKKEA